MEKVEKEKKIDSGRLFDVKENNNTLLIGSYRSKYDREISINHVDELENLCYTYGIDVKKKVFCSLKKINVATFIGKGKIAIFIIVEFLPPSPSTTVNVIS